MEHKNPTTIVNVCQCTVHIHWGCWLGRTVWSFEEIVEEREEVPDGFSSSEDMYSKMSIVFTSKDAH
jgi:hypothetical protein